MRNKEVNYIIDLVQQHPGEFTPTDVVKKIRLHMLNIKSEDPGLAFARQILAQAFRTKRIYVQDNRTCWGGYARNRCFPC